MGRSQQGEATDYHRKKNNLDKSGLSGKPGVNKAILKWKIYLSRIRKYGKTKQTGNHPNKIMMEDGTLDMILFQPKVAPNGK